MIEVIAFIAGGLLALLVWDVRRIVRLRRERDAMRHLTGAREWWGRR